MIVILGLVVHAVSAEYIKGTIDSEIESEQQAKTFPAQDKESIVASRCSNLFLRQVFGLRTSYQCGP